MININGYISIAYGVSLDPNTTIYRLLEYNGVARQKLLLTSFNTLSNTIVFNLPANSTPANTIGVYDKAIGGNLLFFATLLPLLTINNTVTIKPAELSFNDIVLPSTGLPSSSVIGITPTNIIGVYSALISGSPIYADINNNIVAGISPIGPTYSNSGANNTVPQISEGDFTQLAIGIGATIDSWSALANICAKYSMLASQTNAGVINRFQFVEFVVGNDSTQAFVQENNVLYDGQNELFTYNVNVVNNIVNITVASLMVTNINIYFHRVLFTI